MTLKWQKSKEILSLTNRKDTAVQDTVSLMDQSIISLIRPSARRAIALLIATVQGTSRRRRAHYIYQREREKSSFCLHQEQSYPENTIPLSI